MKKSYDFFTDEQRRALTNQIITYFAQERNEEIGIIAAGEF